MGSLQNALMGGAGAPLPWMFAEPLKVAIRGQQFSRELFRDEHVE
jgi:hypothetical protein